VRRLQGKHNLAPCVPSLQGEAVAFALGGNSKMMRAKNLGSLVNSDLAGLGHHRAAAQVKDGSLTQALF